MRWLAFSKTSCDWFGLPSRSNGRKVGKKRLLLAEPIRLARLRTDQASIGIGSKPGPNQSVMNSRTSSSFMRCLPAGYAASLWGRTPDNKKPDSIRFLMELHRQLDREALFQRRIHRQLGDREILQRMADR